MSQLLALAGQVTSSGKSVVNALRGPSDGQLPVLGTNPSACFDKKLIGDVRE
ncbi:hypothetical protein [Actinomadura madurae]|uniref:hypothetical protein n=1 Tax=Actinomadura madurae TaxID=1993 RepID=UPI00399B6CF9